METLYKIALSKYSKKRCLFKCQCGNVVERIYKCGIKSKTCGRCWEIELRTNNTYSQLVFDDEILPEDTTNSKKWWKCSCGNRKLIIIKSVLSKYTKSCGCRNNIPMVGNCDNRKTHMINLADIFNQQFDKLKLIDIRKIALSIGSEEQVLFACDCGKNKLIKLGDVTRGNTISCGQCDLIELGDYIDKKFGHLMINDDRKMLIGLHSCIKIKCKCSCGRQHEVRADHLFSGRTKTCGKCSENGHKWWNGKEKLAIDTRSKKEKYQLNYLTDYFRGSYLEPLHSVDAMRSPIRMKCKLCDEIFTTRLDWVYNSKTISCGCIGFRKSKLNVEFGQMLLDLGCNVSYEKKIAGFSYDLFVNNKVLCECHGLRYHSTQLRDSREVDRIKRKNAIDHGYKYVMVYEDEINALMARIVAAQAGQSVFKHSVRPQKMTIRQVKSRDLNDLYNSYHYLGKVSASLNYAIIYNNTIVAGISFRNPTRQNTQGIELCRMCVDHNYKIYGLWSWFFSHVDLPEVIVSYCDDRLFDGHTYAKLGFVVERQIKQDYYWVKNNKRYHKSVLRKPKGCEITEFELRESQGYHRIYDLGKTKWCRKHRKVKSLINKILIAR